MLYDIAIIGAGASGLMYASFLPKSNIAIIENNSKIGLKILASGGGKCNITNQNVTYENYLGDKNFVKKILDNFTQHDLLNFVNKFNLDLEERRYGQFFCKKSAKDVVNIFEKLTRHCHFFMNTKVTGVQYENYFKIKAQNKTVRAKKLVVASGGMSYANIGASSIGYDIAKSFGHNIVTPSPALVGLTVQKEQFWMKKLSGISFEVAIHIGKKTLQSELLFTHKGISGPAVLSGSLYWNKGKISIDFLPNNSLKNLLDCKSNKLISSKIPLPKRFLVEFLKSLNIEDSPINKLKQNDIDKLHVLKNYEFAPAGNFGFNKAEVTKGGVKTDEIDKNTLESKLQKNLYFIGEVLDVTGELGGYNFQWAFASAVKSAKGVVEK